MENNIINFEKYKKAKGLIEPFMPCIPFKEKAMLINFVKNRDIILKKEEKEIAEWNINFLRMCMYPSKFPSI